MLTAGNVTDVLTTVGLEYVSEREKLHVNVYVYAIECMFKLTHSDCQ